MIKRLLALLLCLYLLPVGAVAADTWYSVESVSESVADPDVLAIVPFEGSYKNLIVNSPLSFTPSRGTQYRSSSSAFGRSFLLNSDQNSSPVSFFVASSFSPCSAFSVEFRLNLSDISDNTKFIFSHCFGLTFFPNSSYHILSLSNSDCLFLNSSEYISSDALHDAFFTGDFVSVKIVYSSDSVYLFVDGHLLGSGSYVMSDLSGFSFRSTRSSLAIDELRISIGHYAESLEEYTPASEPFEVPYIPALPESPVDNHIYFVSDLPAGILSFGAAAPVDAAAGDLWLQLDSNNVCTAAQFYDGSAWSDAIAAICLNGNARDVIGYQFDLGAPDMPIDPDAPHDFLSTPFTAYTVTEGLLLALLLCVVAAAILKLIKEGFYWLW